MPKFNGTAAAFLTALLILWGAGFLAFSVHLKGLPHAGDEYTEAIIVLTGGPDRINTGLDLLESGKADYLFISGVDTRVSADQLVKMWRDGARTPCCIILGHKARNTFENAAEARDWIEVNGIQSARLLTADYHMPRARLAFASMLPGMDLRPHPVTSGNGGLPHHLFVTLNEYNKTLLTWLRLRTKGAAP